MISSATGEGVSSVGVSSTETSSAESVSSAPFSSSSAVSSAAIIELEAPGKSDGYDTKPRIAASADGTFAVIWEGDDADEFPGIYAQLFDADGNKRGGIINIQVDDNPEHSDSAAEIAAVDGNGQCRPATSSNR